MENYLQKCRFGHLNYPNRAGDDVVVWWHGKIKLLFTWRDFASQLNSSLLKIIDVIFEKYIKISCLFFFFLFISMMWKIFKSIPSEIFQWWIPTCKTLVWEISGLFPLARVSVCVSFKKKMKTFFKSRDHIVIYESQYVKTI